MSNRRESGAPEPQPDRDWQAVEQDVLEMVKDVARRITERVRKVTEDTAPNPALKPDDPTGEAPPAP